jgi:cation-transporting ATPase 13A3/4/5
MLTALSVARDCSIIDPGGKVIFPQVALPSLGKPPEITWLYAEDTHTQVTEVITGDQGHTVDIPEPDRICFALTGTSWERIRKYFPEILSKLVVMGLVFARMSPEQKQQLVEELQSLGSVATSQCNTE